MTQPDWHNQNSEQAENSQKDESGSSTGRKVAEWVTLGLSVAIVLALAIFLFYRAVQQDTPYVPVAVRPLMEQVHRDDGRYILPVEVRNLGRHTLKDFEGRLTYRTPDGSEEHREFKVDYLAEQATEKRYFYFEQHPRDLQIRVRPLGYGLE